MRVLIHNRKPVPELKCNHCNAVIARYEPGRGDSIVGSPVLPATIRLSSSGLLPCPRCGRETDIALPNFCLNWYLWVINNASYPPTFV